MGRNLNNIDDIFKGAYDGYEEQPSAAAWQKLEAALDKRDTEKYKRRFIGWKRIAIILFVMLSALMLYKAKSVNPGSNNDTPVAENELKVNKAGVIPQYPNSSIETPKQKIVEGNIKNPAHTTVAEQGTARNAGSSNSMAEPGPPVYSITPDSHDNNTVTLQKPNASTKRVLNTKANDEGIYRSNQVHQNNLAATTGSKKQNQNAIATGGGKAIDYREKIVDYPVPLLARLDKRKNVGMENSVPQFLETTSASNLHASSTNNITAANTIKISHYKPYWTVGGFLSNNWSYYRLDNDDHHNHSNRHDRKEEIEERENHESSFSAGVSISRQFKRWGVKTGLVYSAMRIGIEPQEVYAAKEPGGKVGYKFVTSSGYGYVNPGFGSSPTVGDSLQSGNASHHLHSVSVPIMIGYRLDRGKFSITPSAGVSANLITQATVQTEIKDAVNKEAVNIEKLKGMYDLYAGFIADINLQYNFNSNFSVNLVPAVSSAFTPITKDNTVKTFPYSFGVGAGLTYKF
ncbi:MAG TPA: hypothetical protein VFV68_15595 [Agriterribacter sp.]|nr:hypothetical protein [Agriterribacter sp.]